MKNDVRTTLTKVCTLAVKTLFWLVFCYVVLHVAGLWDTFLEVITTTSLLFVFVVLTPLICGLITHTGKGYKRLAKIHAQGYKKH